MSRTYNENAGNELARYVCDVFKNKYNMNKSLIFSSCLPETYTHRPHPPCRGNGVSQVILWFYKCVTQAKNLFDKLFKSLVPAGLPEVFIMRTRHL